MKEKNARNTQDLPEITLQQFAELVKQMRFNQRRYFRFRRPEILETCNKLEKEVDDIVAKVTDTQMKLF